MKGITIASPRDVVKGCQEGYILSSDRDRPRVLTKELIMGLDEYLGQYGIRDRSAGGGFVMARERLSQLDR